MKKCDTCIYRNNVEQLKPCIIYRDNCEYYEKERDMTREEAIQVLRHIIQVADTSDCGIKEIDGIDEEALDIAIKALEQEPCEDVVKERYEDLCEYFGGAKDILKNREDFKAWLGRVKWHIHKAEELSAENDDLRDQLVMRDRFHKQEPKTGHWIKTISENGITSAVRCSICGFEDNRYMLFRYCPNCGCRMIEPQESEE